jgi:hypothetical protein
LSCENSDMSNYLNKDSKSQIGDISQIASVRPIRLSDGPDDGTRALDIRMAGGLHVLVLTDRGMDIGPAWYEGHPLAWISPTGMVHPAYGDDSNWLRLFHGGLLVTAGLENVGLPNEDEGRAHGLHGRLSLTPARNVRWEMSTADPGTLEVKGTVREVVVHGSNLALHRTLRFRAGSAVMEIHDEVENLGFEPTPFMLLYHFNLGYPVLDDGARFFAPPRTTLPFDEASKSGTTSHETVTSPHSDAAVEVFKHVLDAPLPEWSVTGVINNGFTPSNGIGASITYRPSQLANLWQWRMMGEGRYVMGIEPANCGLAGRASERKSGTLDILEPGEKRNFDLRFAAATGDKLSQLSKPVTTFI